MEKGFQDFIDSMSNVWREERKKSQMTLGKFIEKLSQYPEDKKITKIGGGHSYRGYYEDLAFELDELDIGRVGDVLVGIKMCLDATFCGWKGGEFEMKEDTPIWISKEGEAFGLKILDIIDGDILTLKLSSEDD